MVSYRAMRNVGPQKSPSQGSRAFMAFSKSIKPVVIAAGALLDVANSYAEQLKVLKNLDAASSDDAGFPPWAKAHIFKLTS